MYGREPLIERNLIIQTLNVLFPGWMYELQCSGIYPLRDILPQAIASGVYTLPSYGFEIDEALGWENTNWSMEPGQTRLTQFGFRTSRRLHTCDRDRYGPVYSPAPLSLLAHVCSESRRLLQSLGNAVTFARFSAPAITWFNFKEDFLHFRWIGAEEDEDSEEDDFEFSFGLCWSHPFSEIHHDDLKLVQRLALDITWPRRFSYGGDIPSAILHVLRKTVGLKELLLVEARTMDDYDRERERCIAYCDSGHSPDLVPLDLEEAG